MEGVAVRVETSGVRGVEVAAGTCLLFDFEDVGPESGFKKDICSSSYHRNTKQG